MMDLHVWVDVPEGTALTRHVPFRFCTRCDREEWANGVVVTPLLKDRLKCVVPWGVDLYGLAQSA